MDTYVGIAEGKGITRLNFHVDHRRGGRGLNGGMGEVRGGRIAELIPLEESARELDKSHTCRHPSPVNP